MKTARARRPASRRPRPSRGRAARPRPLPFFANARGAKRPPDANQGAFQFTSFVASAVPEQDRGGLAFPVRATEDPLQWYGAPALAWVSVGIDRGFWEPAVVRQVYNGGRLVEVHIPHFHRDPGDTTRVPSEQIRRGTGHEPSWLARREAVQAFWDAATRRAMEHVRALPAARQASILEQHSFSRWPEEALAHFDREFARPVQSAPPSEERFARFEEADQREVAAAERFFAEELARAQPPTHPAPSKRELVRALLRRVDARERRELVRALETRTRHPTDVIESLLRSASRALKPVPAPDGFARDPAAMVALVEELGLHGGPHDPLPQGYATSRAMEFGVEPWMDRASGWYDAAEREIRADDAPAIQAFNKADRSGTPAQFERAAKKLRALEATRPARIAARARELYLRDAERGISGTDLRYLALPNPPRGRRPARRRPRAR